MGTRQHPGTRHITSIVHLTLPVRIYTRTYCSYRHSSPASENRPHGRTATIPHSTSDAAAVVLDTSTAVHWYQVPGMTPVCGAAILYRLNRARSRLSGMHNDYARLISSRVGTTKTTNNSSTQADSCVHLQNSNHTYLSQYQVLLYDTIRV